MKSLLSLIILTTWSSLLFSQTNTEGVVQESIPEKQICLSEEQRQQIIQQNRESIKQLGLEKEINKRVNVALGWPLKQAAGFNDPDYYVIYNFVDQDPGSGVLDYNCGNRTYNGHHGTDILVWPFMWYKLKAKQVEIVAAADGTIINKSDGNYDLNCSCSGNWNAVYVMHTDVSVAWYGHMKSGSLTTKLVGQTVVKGEYLGSVGSSGCSTAPHLHFELYQDPAQTILLDPFQGPCNSLNSNSWWEAQKPYIDPQLLKIMIHDCSSISQPDVCPSNVYEMCEQYNIQAGSSPKFSVHFRQQQSGQVTNLLIRKPNGTIYTSWTLTSPATYIYGSWWFWTNTIPAAGPYGTWTYEVTDEGNTVIKPFEVNVPNAHNVGIGIARPAANLHVGQGDVYVQNIGSGIIIRSPDGKCWRISINNSGALTMTNIMCPD
jgi:hypothetical protein